MEKLSFVIPCYGSELTIGGVLDEIHDVMAEKPEYDYEIICVNDCSPDGVLEVLKKRTASDSKLIVLDLTKNMGKISAMLAGYSIVSGEYVVNLDDDGQCPVNELWRLLEPVENGFDVAFAGYPEKKQSAFKNLCSRVNARMSSFLIGKPKDLITSNFSVMKRFIMVEMTKCNNLYFSGVLLKSTNRITNIYMEQRERYEGRSNFTFRKSLSLFMYGLTGFSVVPLRISSIVGSITAMFGFFYGAVIVLRRLFFAPYIAVGFPSIMAAILFIGGMIMLMLGMLGEYVGRIYISINNFPQYVIREVYRYPEKKLQHEETT